MVRVVGIGAACWDYLLRVSALADVPRGCRLLGFRQQGGGPVATAMVAVSRLGGTAELWTALGHDDHGRLIEEELRREGVDTSRIVRLPRGPSLYNVVLVDGTSGERVFLGPQVDWQLAEAGAGPDPGRLDGAGALLVTTSWRPLTLAALRRARERGIPTCADVGHIAGNEDILALVDYLIVPRHAALAYAGSAGPECLPALASFGARFVAVTLGAEGAIWAAGGGPEEMPAFPVQAVDTTGAGDVFHGAFCYGLACGWEPRQLMLFSSAVAALKCTQLGGRTGIPRLEEVRRFLRERAPSEDQAWLGHEA